MKFAESFAKILSGSLFNRMNCTRVLSLLFSRSVLLSAVVSFLPLASAQQQNPRNVFPGRRVGGGTRGECTARVLAHLVPGNSVFSPAATGDLALVRGPSPQPVPLAVSFKPQQGGAEDMRRLPALPAGITVLRTASVQDAVVWESAFACAGDEGTSSESLSFVETASPPALSLLVAEAESQDLSAQKAVATLRQKCGSSVPTAETLARFGLEDLATAQWPKHLPIDCPD